MPIEQIQRRIAHRLLLWAGLSITTGAILHRLRSPFWRGVGFQFMIWGTIDGLIALIARKTKPVQQMKNGIRQFDQENQKKKNNLAILLWVNTVMDIFYVIAGLWLKQSNSSSNPFRRSQGVGIIIQGGFLFIFDLVHAIWLSNRNP